MIMLESCVYTSMLCIPSSSSSPRSKTHSSSLMIEQIQLDLEHLVTVRSFNISNKLIVHTHSCLERFVFLNDTFCKTFSQQSILLDCHKPK